MLNHLQGRTCNNNNNNNTKYNCLAWAVCVGEAKASQLYIIVDRLKIQIYGHHTRWSTYESLNNSTRATLSGMEFLSKWLDLQGRNENLITDDLVNINRE